MDVRAILRAKAIIDDFYEENNSDRESGMSNGSFESTKLAAMTSEVSAHHLTFSDTQAKVY